MGHVPIVPIQIVLPIRLFGGNLPNFQFRHVPSTIHAVPIRLFGGNLPNSQGLEEEIVALLFQSACSAVTFQTCIQSSRSSSFSVFQSACSAVTFQTVPGRHVKKAVLFQSACSAVTFQTTGAGAGSCLVLFQSACSAVTFQTERFNALLPKHRFQSACSAVTFQTFRFRMPCESCPGSNPPVRR